MNRQTDRGLDVTGDDFAGERGGHGAMQPSEALVMCGWESFLIYAVASMVQMYPFAIFIRHAHHHSAF